MGGATSSPIALSTTVSASNRCTITDSPSPPCLVPTPRNAHPAITVPDSTRRTADELLTRHQIDGDYVVLHPSVGEFSNARNWYPDRFAAVARAISERHGLRIVLVGARDTIESADQISRLATVTSLVGETDFPELAAVLERAKLVIGADSGVVHLAAALDTPVIAIFGPSNHEEWKPFGAQIVASESTEPLRGTCVVVRSDLPCSPCFYTGYNLGRREGCALRTCLDRVAATHVTQIATQILT